MTDLERARRTGAWLVHNQVRETQGVNGASMDVGRFPINLHIHDHTVVDGFLSTNWFTGMAVYGLLMLYDLDGDDRWAACARQAGHYLRAIQLTMDPDPAANGALYEYAPYAKMCCPRDALSGAWGMLRLARLDDDLEYRNRAELFAGWHSTQALKSGYPVWSHTLGRGGNKELFGNFQAGSSLFYTDLYELTGNEAWLKISLGISDFFMDNFWDNETGICITYDETTGYRGDYRESNSGDWNEMHKFNDDFSAVALMLNSAVTGDEKYLGFTWRYLDWVLANQNEDGSFGKLKLEVSSCVAAQNLLNGWLITGRQEYLEGARRARTHLLTGYQDTPGCPATDGGVRGLYHCVVPEKPEMISLRSTNYTIYTLLLFGIVEAMEQQDTIPPALLRNPMLPGLRFPEGRQRIGLE